LCIAREPDQTDAARASDGGVKHAKKAASRRTAVAVSAWREVPYFTDADARR